MKENEFRSYLLISTQRALLGMIYPSIRAIAVGFEGVKILKLVCYLDREPNDDDFDNISEITGEICSDIEFQNVEERCIYTQEPIFKLDNLSCWVYIRKEL